VGWARASLHLVLGTPAEFGSLRESLAVGAWRKMRRIELLKTIAQVTATVNPEKAQKALSNLIEEEYPEIKEERQQSVDKALDVMKEESKKSYHVRPLDEDKPKGLVEKIRKIVKRA